MPHGGSLPSITALPTNSRLQTAAPASLSTQATPGEGRREKRKEKKRKKRKRKNPNLSSPSGFDTIYPAGGGRSSASALPFLSEPTRDAERLSPPGPHCSGNRWEEAATGATFCSAVGHPSKPQQSSKGRREKAPTRSPLSLPGSPDSAAGSAASAQPQDTAGRASCGGSSAPPRAPALPSSSSLPAWHR